MIPPDEIGRHWFEAMADHMGEAYLRYSFTKGTVQEVDFLIEEMDLEAGMRILDVGCGPGRHANELARRGFIVHGIDISQTFVDVARRSAQMGATFERMDARAMTFDSEFDAAICLCQGAFGLMTSPGHDELVLRGIRRALRPGGVAALSAFNAYFTVKYHVDAEFDADIGVARERTEIRDTTGRARQADLWTGCYTPRELRLICREVDMEVSDVFSVEPGNYSRTPPTGESPEFLVIAFATPFRRKGDR